MAPPAVVPILPPTLAIAAAGPVDPWIGVESTVHVGQVPGGVEGSGIQGGDTRSPACVPFLSPDLAAPCVGLVSFSVT